MKMIDRLSNMMSRQDRSMNHKEQTPMMHWDHATEQTPQAPLDPRKLPPNVNLDILTEGIREQLNGRSRTQRIVDDMTLDDFGLRDS